MSNPTITTKFASPDPGENPLNLIQLFALANTLVSSVINEPSFNTFIIQSGAPDVDDNDDKVWFEIDSAGKPISIRVLYNGTWRRVYNGMPGEVRMFAGNPADYFDTTGLGKIGGLYDGWALCNGQNGVTNLTDHFIIAAHMDDSNGHTKYDAAKGGWQTFVDGKADNANGGLHEFMIGHYWLPPLDNSSFDTETGGPQSTGLYLKGKESKETEAHQEITPLVDIHYANLKPHDFLITRYGASPKEGNPQLPLPTLPPYIALGFIQFVGYT